MSRDPKILTKKANYFLKNTIFSNRKTVIFGQGLPGDNVKQPIPGLFQGVPGIYNLNPDQ